MGRPPVPRRAIAGGTGDAAAAAAARYVYVVRAVVAAMGSATHSRRRMPRARVRAAPCSLGRARVRKLRYVRGPWRR